MPLKDDWAAGNTFTAADQNAVAAAVNGLATAFSTADYDPVSGDDRPRVAAAVAAAVAAITATGDDQTVLIHAPLTFTTGSTKAALSSTADPNNAGWTKLGVPIPCGLTATLNIVFAPAAKITLSAACINAFYINKLADYDVFQNVNFYDAWVDGANVSGTGEAHALIGNGLGAYPNLLRYLSFQDINFFGYTRFTNFYWIADGSEAGQMGIVFRGEHNGPLEATQTFSKNIYLENGDMEGGGGLFWVATAGSRHRPGGCNHYYDNITVDRYRCVMPSAPTAYGDWHANTGVFICGYGFGDRCYIGPGYVENIGDDAVEVGAMQQVDIVSPRSKNPWFYGVFLRQAHAPIDVDSQKITIRGLRCEVTSALTATTGPQNVPIGILCDDHVALLTSSASGGTFTLTVGSPTGAVGTTAALNWNSSAATIAAAIHTAVPWITATGSGGPLNTTPVTITMAGADGSYPLSATSSLTGGTLAVTPSPSNAAFGTITIEDPVIAIDGLTYSKNTFLNGLFIQGLNQGFKKVDIVRPKFVLSNYVYDSAADHAVNLLTVSAPYSGWGNVSIRDCEVVIDGDFSAAAGNGFLTEVTVDGDHTRLDIDGYQSDRSGAVNGTLQLVSVAQTGGSHIRVQARDLTPVGVPASATNRGIRLFSGGTVDQFDVFDCDFSQGTDSSAAALDVSSAGGNASVVRTGNNIFPGSADPTLSAALGGDLVPNSLTLSANSFFLWNGSDYTTLNPAASAGAQTLTFPAGSTGTIGAKVAVPSTATSTGFVGQWAADSSFFYVCTATNTWRRVAIASW